MKPLVAIVACIALPALLVSGVHLSSRPAAQRDDWSALEQSPLPAGVTDVRGYWVDGQSNFSRATAVCEIDGETCVLYRGLVWEENRPHVAGKFCWPCYVLSRHLPSQGNIECLPYADWQQLAAQGAITRTTRAALWRECEPVDQSVEDDLRQEVVDVARLHGLAVRDVFLHRRAVFVLSSGTDAAKEALQDDLNQGGYVAYVVP